jgi:hypothetical protein
MTNGKPETPPSVQQAMVIRQSGVGFVVFRERGEASLQRRTLARGLNSKAARSKKPGRERENWRHALPRSIRLRCGPVATVMSACANHR